MTRNSSRARHALPPRLPIASIEPDAKLALYDAGPAWLRWLDDKSVAAVPSAGGAVITMGWQDLCAELAPHLVGNDAAFAQEQDTALPRALARLHESLSHALADVKAGRPSAQSNDDVARPIMDVSATAAECTLRVLLSRAVGRSAEELPAVARALSAVPLLHFDGPAGALAKERAAEKLAPRAAAAAAIVGFLGHVPLGASLEHGGWLGAHLERQDWKWFEAAVVPLTFTASVARMLASGLEWRGRFSVTALATRGRVFENRA